VKTKEELDNKYTEIIERENLSYVYDTLIDDLYTATEEIEKLKRAVNYTYRICMCERFTTNGFDYHEQHPRKDKNNGGTRPATPRDYLQNMFGFEWVEGGWRLSFSKLTAR
jgi:hypothetical protein